MASFFSKVRRPFSFSQDETTATKYKPLEFDEGEAKEKRMDNLKLGIETGDGKIRVIIPRNATIPTKNEIVVSTAFDNQSSMLIRVYEGDSPWTYKDCCFVGSIWLYNIPPAPKSVVKVNVCCEINAKGTIKVSAQLQLVPNLNLEKKKEITISKGQWKRSRKVLVNNIKGSLWGYAVAIRNTMKDGRFVVKLEMKQEEKEKIEKAIEECCKMHVSTAGNTTSAKVDEYKAKLKELEGLWNPIVTKMYHLQNMPSSSSPPLLQVQEEIFCDNRWYTYMGLSYTGM